MEMPCWIHVQIQNDSGKASKHYVWKRPTAWSHGHKSTQTWVCVEPWKFLFSNSPLLDSTVTHTEVIGQVCKGMTVDRIWRMFMWYRSIYVSATPQKPLRTNCMKWCTVAVITFTDSQEKSYWRETCEAVGGSKDKTMKLPSRELEQVKTRFFFFILAFFVFFVSPLEGVVRWHVIQPR